MFFGTTILPEEILVIDLKVIIRAVIEEDTLFSLYGAERVFIKGCLDPVVFFGKHAECSVNVLQLKGCRLKKALCEIISSKL